MADFLIEQGQREMENWVKQWRNSTDGEPVAMYVVPPDADEAYRTALEELTGESEMAAWVWNAGVDEMPTLPI